MELVSISSFLATWALITSAAIVDPVEYPKTMKGLGAAAAATLAIFVVTGLNG